MKLFTLYGDLELATLNFNSGVEAAKAQMQGLKTQMDGLQEDATKTGGILEGAFGYALGDILSGVTRAAIETAFAFGTEGVELAASMEEIQNVVETTFGDATSSKINAWARGAKEAYGLGALSAKDYANTMGATLKGMGIEDAQLYEMSTTLVGLAGDMASFRNLDTDVAFRKIMSGMTGEMEPLKQLGIIMSEANLKAHALAMGIETDWSKLGTAMQTQVRYNYLMQQTSDMHGDFSKTSDSYTNQLRLMQENIEQLKLSMGESLLPVLNELVGWFNSLFGGSENASAGLDAIKDSATDSIVSIETTTANALALVNALKDLEETGEDASSSETWDALLGQLRTTIPEIGKLIDTETGKITGGTAALEAYVAQWRTTSMQLAQQKVVQDMYDEYAVLQAELAKLQTEQNIADTLRAGAAQSMDEMGADLFAVMLQGMVNMGASEADIKAFKSVVGETGAENLLARMSAEGAWGAGLMSEVFKGGDWKRNKSYEKYFEAGGGTDEMLSNMIALYQGYQKTFEQYNIDNADEIAERQALLAGQEQEIAILQQMLAQLVENGNTVVNVTLDSDPIAAKVEQRISRNSRNKAFTAVAFGQ